MLDVCARAFRCLLHWHQSCKWGGFLCLLFLFLKSPFKFVAAIWYFHYDFELNNDHFWTLEVKVKHKNFHSALGSLTSLMGGRVDCSFFLPDHVILIPVGLLTQKIMCKTDYMEECLERPTEIQKKIVQWAGGEGIKNLVETWIPDQMRQCVWYVQNAQYTEQLLLRETSKTVNIFITTSDLSPDSSWMVHRKESFNVYFHIYVSNVLKLLLFISKSISWFWFLFSFTAQIFHILSRYVQGIVLTFTGMSVGLFYHIQSVCMQ